MIYICVLQYLMTGLGFSKQIQRVNWKKFKLAYKKIKLRIHFYLKRLQKELDQDIFYIINIIFCYLKYKKNNN